MAADSPERRTTPSTKQVHFILPEDRELSSFKNPTSFRLGTVNLVMYDDRKRIPVPVQGYQTALDLQPEPPCTFARLSLQCSTSLSVCPLTPAAAPFGFCYTQCYHVTQSRCFVCCWAPAPLLSLGVALPQTAHVTAMAACGQKSSPALPGLLWWSWQCWGRRLSVCCLVVIGISAWCLSNHTHLFDIGQRTWSID